MEKEPDLEQEGGVEVVNKPAIKGGEEEGENRGCKKGCQKKEDPPSSLQREEVNNNDLGRRSPWWGGGRKEPLTSNHLQSKKKERRRRGGLGIQDIVTLRGNLLGGNFLVPEPTLKTNPFKQISMVVEWRWRDQAAMQLHQVGAHPSQPALRLLFILPHLCNTRGRGRR